MIRRNWLRPLVLLIAASGVVQPHAPLAGQPPPTATAIVGATVIDGNGGAPLTDATVLVRGDRIAAVGPRTSVTVPRDATVIDGEGTFVTPGFIDTNVHVSMYNGGETAVRYYPRRVEVALEAAQLHLKYGVTTIRDSYGMLEPLLAVRDAIASGRDIGPRLLVAGNVVGWGGPFSISFSVQREIGLTLFQEQLNDAITQGTGEELIDMTPEELRVAINTYLDKGVDFIKYGGTTHTTAPTFLGFSPAAQKVIVDEAHKRGLVAETHATSSEGLRVAVEAGVDLIQHPEVLGREIPSDLVATIKERRLFCAVLANTITGAAWTKQVNDQENAAKKKADAEKETESARKAHGHTTPIKPRPKTQAELRAEDRAKGGKIEVQRKNAEKLIRAGAVITVATDNLIGIAPEFMREPARTDALQPGIGTLQSIEGLVELGMTPGQALVAATKHGAQASRLEKDLGTIESGKIADLVLLDADPLIDISNVRKIRLVIRAGRAIDPAHLPERPVFTRPLRSAQ